MRIDIVSIFPAYLDALQLSLVGKAAEAGLVELHVHDLRDVTTDRHRTVDDTPVGGGAGMVMRPDVWGRMLDPLLGLGPAAPAPAPAARASLLGPLAPDAGQTADGPRHVNLPGRPRRILAIPTPAGTPLTQATAFDLAGADQLVIACGRYEGIDARVADHYAARGVEVHEFSLGDFVLNGGEVAALALVEAVVRLVPGVVGNPESLVEESHGAAGLLEYPVYTRPLQWHDQQVPTVLTSGNHAAIRRWRRDQALSRTAARRPDMLSRLQADQLDRADRLLLAHLGWYAPQDGHPTELEVRPARPQEADALATLAAVTFPAACPPELPQDAIAQHIATHLTTDIFTRLIADPQADVLVAATRAGLVGYSVCLLLPGGQPHWFGEELPPALAPLAGQDLVEMSKCYVLPAARGTGVAARLIEASVQRARERHASHMWLGTNKANRHARKAYERAGFEYAGRRNFEVAGLPQSDVAYLRRL
ncbi:tRNA (guanosine(37)-N1)-methyltransferase TrmD [Buchananella hordeovulneris]|uniref:tRNA (guanine-N(1)-)-methyltransferase n=1 Tax=Buchananella hordeovulneris TaxID=52770 RepID=A0A1Q5PXG5_9ACTO|nr:tRNA (guanosine(37)-N1)-methyltransferase TrmD [Buchananella hordeovulneris]OKL52142.1 tRNA (guanosine(37)-N1)-methyltransferase TrmD [Buchananella hordeovulneris]